MVKQVPTQPSFVPVDAGSHFPIQNLPWGIFSRKAGGRQRVGVRIGEWVVDMAVLQARGFFKGPHLQDTAVFDKPALNDFMALGRPAWQEARAALQTLLAADNPVLRDDAELRARVLHPLREVNMHLPAAIGDYTDFYSSEHHATNVGQMFRPDDDPLPVNWKHLPVGYHGRASSVVVSGTEVIRPWGQVLHSGESQPRLLPSAELDFELEVGFFVGPGNVLGQPIPIGQAEDHIFGLVLVNDWSARDIQRWEYRPLGPFLAKNFATSISPWVVTLEALAPFCVPGPEQSPVPLPYLQTAPITYDIQLEVALQSQTMAMPHIVCHTNYRHLYWNAAQQLAHHTLTGCNVRPGDLLASGTISGPAPGMFGSLLELAWRGTQPISVGQHETRTFLEDGDTVTISGWCQGAGFCVGFGQVAGKIVPAHAVEGG